MSLKHIAPYPFMHTCCFSPAWNLTKTCAHSHALLRATAHVFIPTPQHSPVTFPLMLRRELPSKDRKRFCTKEATQQTLSVPMFCFVLNRSRNQQEFLSRAHYCRPQTEEMQEGDRKTPAINGPYFLSGEAESDNVWVSSDHFITLASCGFVYVKKKLRSC